MTDPRIRVTQLGDTGEQELHDALDGPTIRVLLPARPVAAEHQLLAEALVDLLARVFPRIDVVCAPDVETAPALGPGPRQLRERLEAARWHGAVDPRPTSEATVTIAIGHDAEAALHVDATDWTSYLGLTPSELAHPAPGLVPIGPLAAAARAAAHAFDLAMADLFPTLGVPDASYASALTWESGAAASEEPAPEATSPLNAVLVGAGSVGGAAVYALARTPGLSGELVIVDPETLEGHNFDRAILATRSAVQAKRAKAELAEETLRQLAPALRAAGVVGTVGYLHSLQNREFVFPPILCAVDSASARRAVQDCLPLDVLNAACGINEVQISGHVTDDGPCVCCLHMADVLNAENARARIISRVTGLPFKTVIGLLIDDPPPPLDPTTLRGIEQNTNRPAGSLSGYRGRSLDDLWREQLMYGGANVESAGGTQAVVAAPWVTALAAFLLAGEAIKLTLGEHAADLRLGPHSSAGARYVENPYASPEYAQLSRPERWGSECLCRSPRRLRILSERYGLT